ncbi:MAG: YHS domain-containing (seleno)protein [Pseudomonadota bacterium]
MLRKTTVMRLIASFSLLLVTLMTHASALAQGNAPIAIGVLNKLAISGYDPVAYFVQNAAVKGSPDHVTTCHGATWRFASASNRDAFLDNPGRYIPQYGGHDPYAMTDDRLVRASPDVWSVEYGRLFLFYSVDVKQAWGTTLAENEELADQYWNARFPDLVLGDC